MAAGLEAKKLLGVVDPIGVRAISKSRVAIDKQRERTSDFIDGLN